MTICKSAPSFGEAKPRRESPRRKKRNSSQRKSRIGVRRDSSAIKYQESKQAGGLWGELLLAQKAEADDEMMDAADGQGPRMLRAREQTNCCSSTGNRATDVGPPDFFRSLSYCTGRNITTGGHF